MDYLNLLMLNIKEKEKELTYSAPTHIADLWMQMLPNMGLMYHFASMFSVSKTCLILPYVTMYHSTNPWSQK